jgi:hypothetical protein
VGNLGGWSQGSTPHSGTSIREADPRRGGVGGRILAPSTGPGRGLGSRVRGGQTPLALPVALGGSKRRADAQAGVGTKAHRGNSRGVRRKLSRHIFPIFQGDLAGQEAFHGVPRFAPCSDPAAPPASLAVTFCGAGPVNLWDGVSLFLDSRQRHQLSRPIFPGRHSGPPGCSGNPRRSTYGLESGGLRR